MRASTSAGTHRAMVRWAVVCAVVLASTGCATLRATLDGYGSGHDGLSRPQRRLREALVASDFPTALAFREEDALLRVLNTGIAAYYASQFERSATLFDSAALIADDRITQSLSKNALGMVTNDLARPYQPRRTERLFIPYYGMLAYLRRDEWEDAAVEARRLVGLLAQYADDREENERGLHASLYHLAGTVFERAGDRGDAQVAHRAAQALAPRLADSLQPRPPGGEGELLVVVERGFVAHRANESIDIWLGDDDRDSLRLEGDSRRRAVGRITDRVVGRTHDRDRSSVRLPPGPWASRYTFHQPRRYDEDDDGYQLRIAFAVLRHSARAWGGPVRLAVDDSAVAATSFVSLLDDASESDERRERAGMVARAVARAAAKYAAVKAVKDKKGELAGTVANIGAALLERADVRSWHLLPQEISLLRVRVPAGTRYVRLEVGPPDGRRTVDVGPVTVRAGTVAIAPVRLWRDPAPAATPPAFAYSYR